MATNNVDIANIALQSLGEPPITSLDGTQRAQKLCSQALPFARDEVLAYHPWAVAVTRTALNELAEQENLTSYDHAYAMPGDVLRIIRVAPGNSDTTVTAEVDYMSDHESSSAYIIEENVIYTNADSAVATYIKRIENPAAYPPYLVEAIAANIAKRIAFALTQNQGLFQTAMAYYSMALNNARQIDGYGRSNKPDAPEQWEDLR